MNDKCDFCTDLRNIEPAKYIDGGNEEFQKWIANAREKKKFILSTKNKFIVVDKCPICGYMFTEEDYDNYY